MYLKISAQNVYQKFLRISILSYNLADWKMEACQFIIIISYFWGNNGKLYTGKSLLNRCVYSGGQVYWQDLGFYSWGGGSSGTPVKT